MEKIKTYGLLHICILIFSFTGVFAKAAANAYNAGGLTNPRLYLFVFCMLAVCVVYALAWQIVIKDISLHVAYANRSVYLIWGQIWAVTIYSEQLSFRNIIGLITVLIGVIIVTLNTDYDEEGNNKGAGAGAKSKEPEGGAA